MEWIRLKEFLICINVIYDKVFKLKDGTTAHEVEFEWVLNSGINWEDSFPNFANKRKWAVEILRQPETKADVME